MAAKGLLDRASWRSRSKEFGAVRVHDGQVVMEFDPRDRVDEWILLRHLWTQLPSHPQILGVIDRGAGTQVLLRFAALDWKHKSHRALIPDVARWGAQITAAYQQIAAADVGHFLRPLVNVDLVDEARLAFLPVARTDKHLPSEIRTSWPVVDERAIVYVIGGAVRELCAAKDPVVDAIIERCCRADAAERYQTLEELRAAWTHRRLDLGLEGERRLAWEHTQAAMGWLAVGQPRTALHLFRVAIHLHPRQRVAKEGRARAMVATGETFASLGTAPPIAPELRGDLRPLTPPQVQTWEAVAERAGRLEAEHELAEALSLYRSVRLDGVNNATVHLAIARCNLGLGNTQHAIQAARSALAIEPGNLAARSIHARGHLLARKYPEALVLVDEWLAARPDDADAHYARGRALFALARFVEARDAFDRATALRPAMLEAMLLRREADRSIKRTADKTGTARALEIEVPAHLAALRDALVSGNVEAAIPVLQRPEYDGDAVAKLVHAECLAFAQRHEDAIEMYDRAIALAPAPRAKAIAGKVHALLALERAAEAIAVVDAERDLDVDLVELRALALHRLGATDDADRELARVVAANRNRSDLRLGR